MEFIFCFFELNISYLVSISCNMTYQVGRVFITKQSIVQGPFVVFGGSVLARNQMTQIESEFLWKLLSSVLDRSFASKYRISRILNL